MLLRLSPQKKIVSAKTSTDTGPLIWALHQKYQIELKLQLLADAEATLLNLSSILRTQLASSNKDPDIALQLVEALHMLGDIKCRLFDFQGAKYTYTEALEYISDA